MIKTGLILIESEETIDADVEYDLTSRGIYENKYGIFMRRMGINDYEVRVDFTEEEESVFLRRSVNFGHIISEFAGIIIDAINKHYERNINKREEVDLTIRYCKCEVFNLFHCFSATYRNTYAEKPDNTITLELTKRFTVWGLDDVRTHYFQIDPEYNDQYYDEDASDNITTTNDLIRYMFDKKKREINRSMRRMCNQQ